MRLGMRLSPVVLALVFGACRDSAPREEGQPFFAVPGTALLVPNLPGWVQDSTVQVADSTQGGAVFRLARISEVSGAPRISVVLDPAGKGSATLEELLTRTLREMAEIEQRGEIHIDFVDQRPARVGPRKAYRVRHEYSMGEGTTQIAITQIATLLVLDGRGIAVIAAGRTELFHPLASSVEQILSGIAVSSRSASSTPVPVAPGVSNLVEPIDLGKVGGAK